MKRGTEIILGIIAFVLIVAVAANLISQESTVKDEIPSYKIASKTDISSPQATKLRYKVVVEPGISEKGIKLIAEDVVNKTKKDMKFNGLVIFMYDREEDVGDYYTIAKVEYLPYGEWRKTLDVRAGDYSKHEFVYDINENVTDSTVKRPTEREFEIHDRFEELYWERVEKLESEYGVPVPDEEFINLEDEVTKQVLREFGITEEEYKEIWIKVVAWQL